MNATKDDLHNVRIFAGLSQAQFVWLHERIQLQSLAPESRIVACEQPAQCVYFLLRGTAKVCAQRKYDNEVVFDILGPGEVIGDLNAIDGLGTSANVVTLENSCVASLSCAEFRDALAQMPTLAHNVIQVLARRLRRRTGQAEILATLNVVERLSHYLLLFLEDYGVPLENGTLLPLQVTQQELGGLIGASRERVNRALNYFKRQSYISLRADGYLVIHNADALRQKHPHI